MSDLSEPLQHGGSPLRKDIAELLTALELDGALQKMIGASEDWRINVIGVRLAASGRAGNKGEATVTYDKVVRLTDRNLPSSKCR